MIVYLAPGEREAHSGGGRKLYDHVDILNGAGERAASVVAMPGEAAKDIEARLPREAELLVVPEVYGDLLRTVAPGLARISLNQNAHYSWLYVTDPQRHPYNSTPSLLKVLCVSEHNRRLLSFAFPQASVERVRLGIPSRFSCGPYPRPKRISLFLRKRAQRAHAVLGVLHSRGSLEGWEVVAMDGTGDDQVVEMMQGSAIVLSLSEAEGLPAPPLEALACGCAVVGFTGFGGGEFLVPAGAAFVRVDDDDVLGFAERLEETMRDIESLAPACELASERVRAEYSREREVASVLQLVAGR